MKVTIVVDNYVPISTPKPFWGEHGFSMLLESNEHKILMDTGQSEAVVKNLSLLGIHPNELDAIVLSHGHYDHAGGLEHILEYRKEPIPVYAHPAIFKDRYSVSGIRHQIGIPCIKEKLSALGAQWHFSSTPLELYPGLWFGGQIPRITDYEMGDTNLLAHETCGECQDSLEDDISLYCRSKRGFVVIGGCAHSGMINTIRHGEKIIESSALQGWIGGTHLGPVTEEQQRKTLEEIVRYKPEFIATGHCTGISMMAKLKNAYKGKLIHCYISQVITFE